MMKKSLLRLQFLVTTSRRRTKIPWKLRRIPLVRVQRMRRRMILRNGGKRSKRRRASRSDR